MASEAAELIAELRAGGMTKQAIADALGRSPRMVTKVEQGATSGGLYVPALRSLSTGGPVEPPPRTQQVWRQRTPAGIVTQTTSAGLAGVYDALLAEGFRDTTRRYSLTFEYRTSTGAIRTGTLYARSGRSPVEIADDLEAFGAARGDAPSIRRAIKRLVNSERSRKRGGDSGLANVQTILSVRVGPA